MINSSAFLVEEIKKKAVLVTVIKQLTGIYLGPWFQKVAVRASRGGTEDLFSMEHWNSVAAAHIGQETVT